MSFILSITKSVLVSYFVVYAFFHSLLYFTPEAGRYLVFQNLSKYKNWFDMVRLKCLFENYF